MGGDGGFHGALAPEHPAQLKQWDIYSYKHPDWPEAHPAVIVSHPGRIAHKPEVTILLCSSKGASRAARPHEVVLDRGDGLDWPTLCKCDLLYTVSKSALNDHRGAVTLERRRQIVRTINRAMGWI